MESMGQCQYIPGGDLAMNLCVNTGQSKFIKPTLSFHLLLKSS